MGKTLLKILGITALLLSASCSEPSRNASQPDPRIELSDQFTGEFALIDQDGREVSSNDLNGKVAVVYFGFATCPDVCPMALSRLSAALNHLSAKELEQIASLFITVDPERDTPAALKAFLEFDPRITGLTGSVEAAAAARQSFKVYAQRQTLEGSDLDYTMNHSSLFYLVDREGKPRLAINDYLAAAELASILRSSIKGRY